MSHQFQTACEVSQYILDKTDRALLENRIEDFWPHFCVPNEIETFDGRRFVKSVDGIRRVFKALRAHYDCTGVTDMVRNCIEASFKDDTTVVIAYETRLITRNLINRQPFPTLSVLKFNGLRWQISSSCYAIDDDINHNAALMSAGDDWGTFPSGAKENPLSDLRQRVLVASGE